MAAQTEIYTDPLKADTSGCSIEDSYFNREKTLALIELFKKYKPAMTKGDIKTMKEMWEIIATDLTNQFGLSTTGAKCQNRFKVLERGYKKMVNDKEAGKRRKKHFPYANEFKDIKPRKYEFVPGLVPPYNNVPIITTEKNDTSSTESAAEVNYTTEVYLDHEGYIQNTDNIEVTQVNQTDYVTETETIGTAEITVQTSAKEIQWCDDSFFNKERTLALIKLVKEFGPQVTVGTIKTKKEMWETIARHMSDQFNVIIPSSKCENRFKVLERNFKHVEIRNRQNNNRPVKRYEFESELREIFGDKFKNISIPAKKEETIPSTSTQPIEITNPPPFTIRVLDAQPIPIELPVPDKIERILLGIRSDLQYYHNERLKVEWRKLAVEEEKLKLNKRKLKLLEDQRNT